MIQLINVGSGGGGGGGGNVTELLNPGILGIQANDVGPGTTNVAAGAYKIVVWNTGVVAITVGGISLGSGEKWEAEACENRATSKFDLCPSVAIVVPANGAAQYQVTRPS